MAGLYATAERRNDDECNALSGVLDAVVTDPRTAVAFSTGFSSPEYPQVWVAPVGNNSCTKTFHQAVRVAARYPKMGEMLMETGMIRFLGPGHYPRLLPAVPGPADSEVSSADPGLTFLPFCFYTEGVRAKSNGTLVVGLDGRRRKVKGTLQWIDGFYKARWRFQAAGLSRTMEQLMERVQGRRVLFVKVILALVSKRYSM